MIGSDPGSIEIGALYMGEDLYEDQPQTPIVVPANEANEAFCAPRLKAFFFALACQW